MVQKTKPEDFTRYEKARILGARALQIAMNAPLLVKLSKEDLEEINYDAIKIAEVEFNSGVLPISVNKPMPIRHESALKREKEKTSDKELEEKETQEEEEISKEGEIMELAQPVEESDEEENTEEQELE